MIYGDLNLFKIQQYTGGTWVDITLTTRRLLTVPDIGAGNISIARNGGDNKSIDTGGFFPIFDIMMVANEAAENTIMKNVVNLLNSDTHVGYYRLYPEGSGTYYEVNLKAIPQSNINPYYAILELVFESRNKVTSF